MSRAALASINKNQMRTKSNDARISKPEACVPRMSVDNRANGSERYEDLVIERLDRIEASLAVLVQQRTVKEWYSTDEVAELLGKAEFTVREWCRNGRIRAEKKGSGRGKYQAWVISHVELQRFQKEGLLQPRRL